MSIFAQGGPLGSASPNSPTPVPPLRAVLFSGGRGAGPLTSRLLADTRIALTIAINGYDDGASTGEVRRFLGDSLGPSDFRKNASRAARDLGACAPELLRFLDLRLPVGCTPTGAGGLFDNLDHDGATSADPFVREARQLLAGLEPSLRSGVALRLRRFQTALGIDGAFDFRDCSLGNLVFAGGYLTAGRNFNAAVADYCELVGLPPGLIENVTDGTNAFLVAVDHRGHVLRRESDIVDATRRNRILDIYLMDRPLTDEEASRLEGESQEAVERILARRSAPVRLNPRLEDRIASADLILYAPGTQHSSLFPSYLTPGLSAAIGANLHAIKLLVTNIQEDAEIADSSAVDIIGRATYYLREKNRLSTPVPCLITHCLINEPDARASAKPYVPLGPLETLEDLRLVRVGNYEDGLSGRHDAAKVLGPFLEALLRRPVARPLAIWMQEATSPGKLVQTLLEMIRGGIDRLPVSITVFYSGGDLDPTFVATLPFAVRNVPAAPPADARAQIISELRHGAFDYVLLFESSGMYDGEDIVGIASHLTLGRLDAVWGSRRLSVRDIHWSLRVRYRKSVFLGLLSYFGSHALSLSYLLLYGRYISDTLSGARAIRATYLPILQTPRAPTQMNQRLLSALLMDQAEMFEIPVRFLPLSPHKVKRPSAFDGMRALASILWWRIAGAVRRVGRDERRAVRDPRGPAEPSAPMPPPAPSSRPHGSLP